MRKLLIKFSIAAGATVACLALLEGTGSLGLLLKDLLAAPPPRIAEELYTRYDPELGWSSLPNVYLPNLYGPGVYLRTNGQGFRNNTDFAAKVPDGVVRIVCSGDSFTLGYGVDNDHTWCEALRTRHAGLETVNMGQGGYGLDQAYLWYRRDGLKIDHQLQIFAVITHDFPRVRVDEFLGHPKPLLRFQARGQLAIENVPVPYLFPMLRRRLAPLMQLRAVQFADRLRTGGEIQKLSEEETGGVVFTILEDLQRIHTERHSAYVLVYLPTQEKWAPELRKTLREETAKLGVPYIDLFEDFGRLSTLEANTLFIADSPMEYRFADGHYTPAGHAYIARILYERLLTFPQFARLLGDARRPSTP